MSDAVGLLEGSAADGGPGLFAADRAADAAASEGRAADAGQLKTFELFEYDERDLPISDRQARLLKDTGMVSVSLGRDPGRWSVRAGHRVGTLVVEDLRILVKPKIRLENLFLLLEAGLRPDDWRREAFDYAGDPDLLPAVISFLARTAETTLARGVFRRYSERRERLTAMRGRPDIGPMIARGGLAFPLDCRYDDFTADVAENRYLKAALRLALRVPLVPAEDRRRLLGLVADLEGVTDVRVEADALDRIEFNRLNEHYRPALHLARLVLENLTLIDRSGRWTTMSFTVDMNDLFERFVTERLRRALRGRMTVRDQHPTHLGWGGAVRMRPDLVFERRGEIVYVGDIKYKLTESGEARNPDYYQMLAYTTALGLGEGALVYCHAEDGSPGQRVTVRNSGQVLHCQPLDLTGPPEDVARQLEALADWIAAQARPAQAPRQSPPQGFSEQKVAV